MRNVIIALLAVLVAQSQNYIESDGKRIYVDSMTDQEIIEYEKSKSKIKPAPVIERQEPHIRNETTPQQRDPIIIRFEQTQPRDYSETIKVKIRNKVPVDKEYYETTGRGTFKKVEIDKGVRPGHPLASPNFQKKLVPRHCQISL